MYNCKKISTTAKLYVGFLQEISTTAKKMAQLRNKMYNCKKKAQLRNTCIAVVHFLAILNYRTNSTFHFSFPFLLISTLPRHPATAVNKVATSRRHQPLLESRHVIFLLLLYSLAFRRLPSPPLINSSVSPSVRLSVVRPSVRTCLQIRYSWVYNFSVFRSPGNQKNVCRMYQVRM
jgi:hypothetical protein